MGSLLVQTTFGERVEGRFVLQSGKRSSENEVQTTFGWGGERSSLERPSATHGFQVFCVICKEGVSKGKHEVRCRLRLTHG
jgi:hypothetical protein